MLKAYIRPGKLTLSGQIFNIDCPELSLTASSKTPSNTLCREIMKVAPERGQETLEVYQGDSLHYTIRCIEDWAGKTVSETDRDGLRVQPFRDYKSVDSAPPVAA